MIDMASVYAERYKQNPQALQAAVMGQSPDPKLDPYTALNALKLVKESQRMAMAGQAQQPTSSPSIVAENVAPPPMMQGLGAMVPGAMGQAPQGMPQRPPMPQPTMQAASGGLAGMYTPEEDYAAGGIVAFNGEDDSVVRDPDATEFVSDPNSGSSMYRRQSDAVDTDPELFANQMADEVGTGKQVKSSDNTDDVRQMIKNAQRGTSTQADDNAALTQYMQQIDRYGGPNIYDPANKRLTEREAARAKSSSRGQGLALLAAAGAILEGNTLARGASKAFPVFAKEMGEVQRADISEQRSIEGMQFALADAQRKERMGDIRGALAARETARKEKNDAAEFELKKAVALGTLDAKVRKDLKDTTKTPTDLINYVNDYVAKAVKNGDKRNVETIRVEGYDKAPMLLIKQEAIAANKAIAGGAQGVTTAGQQMQAQSTGIREFNDLDNRDPAKKAYRDASKLDKANAEKGIKSDLAGKVRRDWIQANTPGAAPAPAAPPPPAAPAASRNALPPGARQIGTSGGKKVYELPNGDRIVEK